MHNDLIFTHGEIASGGYKVTYSYPHRNSLLQDIRYRKVLIAVLFNNFITNSDHILPIILRWLFAIYKPLAFSEISVKKHLEGEMWNPGFRIPGVQPTQLSVLNLQFKGMVQWCFSARRVWAESRAQWIGEKTVYFFTVLFFWTLVEL